MSVRVAAYYIVRLIWARNNFRGIIITNNCTPHYMASAVHYNCASLYGFSVPLGGGAVQYRVSITLGLPRHVSCRASPCFWLCGLFGPYNIRSTTIVSNIIWHPIILCGTDDMIMILFKFNYSYKRGTQIV